MIHSIVGLGGIAGLLAYFTPCAIAQDPSPLPQSSDEKLDVNDVSFLWPVPKTKQDAEALISLSDESADGPIMPLPVFKALMEKAKTIDGISFPHADFENPHAWKVAGIRINPTALGSHPKALAVAEVPGVRLIVQPVTIKGEKARVHDFAAHVVFNYVQQPPVPPIKPDRAAFERLVQDLRVLKTALNLPNDPGNSKLGVHPGFLPDPVPLTGKLKALLKEHLSSKNLDRRQVAAISFMGIPGRFEPWIFFKVEVDTATGTLTQKPVSGKFDPASPLSHLISFLNDEGEEIQPRPLQPKSLQEVHTALLFAPGVSARLDDSLFAGATEPELSRWRLRDVADIVANPQITTTLSADCVSCHTDSTRRHKLGGLTFHSAAAFALPAGISGVNPKVLPKDRWNVRNFGWGFNFGDDERSDENGFMPTVSQRAANEAAESAAYINEKYPPGH